MASADLTGALDAAAEPGETKADREKCRRIDDIAARRAALEPEFDRHRQAGREHARSEAADRADDQHSRNQEQIDRRRPRLRPARSARTTNTVAIRASASA